MKVKMNKLANNATCQVTKLMILLKILLVQSHLPHGSEPNHWRPYRVDENHPLVDMTEYVAYELNGQKL